MRSTKNFINVSFSMATKNQKYFAYMASGNFLPPRLEFHAADKLIISSYNTDIQSKLRYLEIKNAFETNKVTIDGTIYRIGHWVILSINNAIITVGQVQSIFIKEEETFLLLERYSTERCYKTGSLKVCSNNIEADCIIINIEKLLDYYPLPSVIMGGLIYLTQKHSIPHVLVDNDL